ncbi:hypothetical protein [Actinoplanes sp. NPDC051494]|uniref:hypothetical protein n=1 Tax=Actinoplanes sp. NPDC051494 TaxID=3363907 RepID=UPI0037B0FE80
MRTSVPAALAALILALPTVLLSSSPARAAAVFVELNPSTVRAGDEIGIRASCDDNLKAGTVTTDPLGEVSVTPRYGFLTATVRVPGATRPADYKVALRCAGGEKAETTLHVVAKVEPVRGPATGGGGTAGGNTVTMLLGGGATAVAAGLLLGLVALRRRRLG